MNSLKVDSYRNCYTPSQSSRRSSNKGAVQYCQMQIPVKNILCVREVPNSHIYPKSRITLLIENPSTKNMPLAVEDEFAGSVKQWTEAIKEAEKKQDTVKFHGWG